MSTAPDEFVTIAHAARLLNVSERQVRRDVRRVSEDDRHVSGTGPARVRLHALVQLRGGNIDEGNGQEESPALSGAASGDVRPEEAATNAGQGNDALIEQLRGEVTFLRSALEREQETARAALEELNKERQRGMIMLAATAAGKIGAFDGAEAGLSNEQKMPNEATGTPPADETPDTRVSAPPDAAEGGKTGFWARLFGKGGG